MLKTLAKRALRTVQSALRERELERTVEHIDRARIAEGLRALGVGEGDALFLHSSLKSLGYVEGGPRAVIDALLDAIGPEGTLVVPTYYQPGGTIYAACQRADYVFDPREHGTDLGALPAAFLKVPGVRRSLHPTHSVSAVGRHADLITATHHLAPSIFGEGSPWERFRHLDGKVLGLGISMGPVTYYHMLEDALGDRFPLPVRMAQTYRLKCRTQDGGVVEVPVRPLDPAFMPRRIDHPSRKDLRDWLMADLIGTGLLHSGMVGSARCWYIGARAFFDRLEHLASRGITIYATAEELASQANR